MATILNKYAWLAETIYEARRITFKEISRKWQENEDLSRGAELPLRTFHKWCDGIFDMFGFMIECDRKNGYTYYIANENEIRRGRNEALDL
ncbi:MAG: hypothetical protein K6A82_08330 [Prevotella sp.]|nr:hypothetical protein [Prevotella sp.]